MEVTGARFAYWHVHNKGEVGKVMLHEFLSSNHTELIERCRAKVAKRSIPSPTAAELKHGIPIFLTQITETLCREQAADVAGSRRISGPVDPDKTPTTTEIGEGAAQHGDELQRQGFTVDQVVHDYGDLCQAITGLAVEQDAAITAAEFRTLNRCLDNAIADAVTRFGTQREESIANEAAQNTNDRLGYLAHELRGKLNVARLAIEAVKRGTVGIAGATGAVLERSLTAMRDILDRSFAEARLGEDLSKQQPQRIPVSQLFEEVQIFAGMEAGAKGLGLTVRVPEEGLAVLADRHTLSSAVSNLLQNAVKFTPTGGRLSLGARVTADRVLIEVADECGGRSGGDSGHVLTPFARRGSDGAGLGLGLSISQRGVEANGGKLRVETVRGRGCIFTIDVPQAAATAA